MKTTKVFKASGSTKNLDVIVEDEICALVKKDFDSTSITPKVEIEPNLEAPIAKNTAIGKITYSIDGNEYSSILLAGSDVIPSNGFTTFLTICSILLALFLLNKLLSSNKKKRRRNNRKKYKRKNNYLYR